MDKLLKRLFAVAAIGSAAAGIFYFFKKTKENGCDDMDDDFEDDLDDIFDDADFDLDSDLKSVSDRDYVPLTPRSEDLSEEENPAEEGAAEEAVDEELAEEEMLEKEFTTEVPEETEN